MNRWLRLLVWLPVILLAGCAGPEPVAFTVLMRGEHDLYYSPGDVYILGGQVSAGPAARLNGSVYLLEGRLALDGVVEKDVVTLGGVLALGAESRVGGDLRLAGGMLEQAPGATIGGQVLRGSTALPLDAPARDRRVGEVVARWLGAALPLAAAGYWLGRRAPDALDRVSTAATRHLLVSAALGALSALGLPALLVAMTFTLVLIPLVLIVALLVGLVIGYGCVAMGWAVGRALRRITRLSAAAATAAGTLLFMLALLLVGLIPVVGVWIDFAAAVVMLGAVFLTRFGTRPFVPAPMENAEL